MVAMLKNQSKEDLGFDKYPAEKSIYLSLLKNLKYTKKIIKVNGLFLNLREIKIHLTYYLHGDN